MGLFTASLYWVIVGVWTCVLVYAVLHRNRNRKIFGSAKVLLFVVAIDAVRDIFENVYFGFYFGSKYGMFDPIFGDTLGHPALLLLPKLANIGAGMVVLFILLLDWLPKAATERTTLDELATVDGMTGLFNRRHFLSLATIEHERAARYGRKLSLMMLDIDYFKKVNDDFGHHVGDIAIAQVARICKQHCREADIPARIGGEEFVVLLPETSLDDAYLVAERIRTTVANLVIPSEDTQVKFTISVGIAERSEGSTLDAIMRHADEALYVSKNAGRNLTTRTA